MTPGSIVRCRNRDWVLLPGDRDDVYLLRPLAGAVDTVVAVHRQLTDLVGYDYPEERVRPSTFEPPAPEDLQTSQTGRVTTRFIRGLRGRLTSGSGLAIQMRPSDFFGELTAYH